MCILRLISFVVCFYAYVYGNCHCVFVSALECVCVCSRVSVCTCECVISCVFLCAISELRWITGLWVFLDLFVLRIIDPSSLIRLHDLGISEEENRLIRKWTKKDDKNCTFFLACNNVCFYFFAILSNLSWRRISPNNDHLTTTTIIF